MCCLHACGDQKRVKDFPGTGVTHGYELPHGCLELNLGHLKDQSMVFTAEPSFHSCSFISFPFPSLPPSLPSPHSTQGLRNCRLASYLLCRWRDLEFLTLLSPCAGITGMYHSWHMWWERIKQDFLHAKQIFKKSYVPPLFFFIIK